MSVHKQQSAIDLSVSPVHFDTLPEAEAPAQVLENFGFDGEAFERYIEKYCQRGPGRILMIESSPQDWTHWECHSEGDEVVVVLEGRGTFFQQVGDEQRSIPVAAGQAVINPKGVWHTANIEQPIRALYITPARGTQHKAR